MAPQPLLAPAFEMAGSLASWPLAGIGCEKSPSGGHSSAILQTRPGLAPMLADPATNVLHTFLPCLPSQYGYACEWGSQIRSEQRRCAEHR